MTELHCTGCMTLVTKDHKCKRKSARLIELSTMSEAKPKGKGFAEMKEQLARVENKLDVLLAMADKRRMERVGK